MEAIEAVLTRRSTRRYSGEMPQKNLVEKVIEAGKYAPSGGNNQTTVYYKKTAEFHTLPVGLGLISNYFFFTCSSAKDT